MAGRNPRGRTADFRTESWYDEGQFQGVVSLRNERTLAGLNALELGRLRMSVGYGTHKKGRPLSPMEVASLLRKAREEGASLQECAKALQLDGTGYISRFLRILDLPDDLRQLIGWGAGKHFIGFTSAVELTRVRDVRDQRTVAQAILSDGLNSKEVQQVAQIRKRSGRSVEACIGEILRMRPKIEKRYVFVGSVAGEDVEGLGRLTQAARDSIVASGIERLGLCGATGRLGAKFFTLAGDERFNASMQDVGKESIEPQLRIHISEIIRNGVADTFEKLPGVCRSHRDLSVTGGSRPAHGLCPHDE